MCKVLFAPVQLVNDFLPLEKDYSTPYARLNNFGAKSKMVTLLL